MLTSIHIQGFKGFKDTLIAPMRKVNLILGGQNVGKTSLLEAVFLGASDINNYEELPTLFRVAEGKDSQRYLQSVLEKGQWLVDLFDHQGRVLRTTNILKSDDRSFFDLREASFFVKKIDVKRLIKGRNIGPSSMAMTQSEMRGLIPPGRAAKEVLFINPLAVSVHLPNQLSVSQMFDKTIMARKKKILLDMLRRIEPRLEDMHSLSPDGEQRIYVELEGDGEALPLPQLGHGFSRLVYLYCSLLVTDAKLALIDEVENGIHYSSLPTLFQGIQDIAAKHDVQTLMTTHSWDCIRAAYKTFADASNLQDFQLIRLERDGDNIRAVVINDEMLDTVMEAGYEVR
ncbi:MAG: AAA family ATPase [Pseudomonadota bacterium]|nr:AAA family ATPase [Pseudomonadota bacterium]